MITDPSELYRFFATPSVEVMNVMFVSADVLWASWRFSDEEKVPCLNHIYEVIGLYVTAGARMHLYIYFWIVCKIALYCDTDSVSYIKHKNEPRLIQCGNNPWYVHRIGIRRILR
jgi:hypothetical protein